MLYEGWIPRCGCASGFGAAAFSFHYRSDRGDEGFLPALESALMDKLSDTDRELAWREIERQLSQFERPNGFEAPGEWLIGVGTK